MVKDDYDVILWETTRQKWCIVQPFSSDLYDEKIKKQWRCLEHEQP